MDWYLMVLRKYAEFNGRSRRKEYWMYLLVNLIICLVLYVGGVAAYFSGQRAVGGALFGLYILYALATLIPSLAVAVRRLHDTNKSGWWILISLVPLIGGIWLLVLLATDSDPGANQFGPNPKSGLPSTVAG
jgi:uncharacterized membrane protein YhaH (DUF805 family)